MLRPRSADRRRTRTTPIRVRSKASIRTRSRRATSAQQPSSGQSENSRLVKPVGIIFRRFAAKHPISAGALRCSMRVSQEDVLASLKRPCSQSLHDSLCIRSSHSPARRSGLSTHLRGARRSVFRDVVMLNLYSRYAFDAQTDSAADRRAETERVWCAFQSPRTDGLAELSGLKRDENRALVASSAIPAAVESVLTGPGRLRRPQRFA
jgi:hypothetical protein